MTIENFFGSREEYRSMLDGKILWKENCPFCDENLDSRAILWEGKFWRIVYNKYPYSWNHQHLMVIPKKHIIFSHQLTAEEYSEMPIIQDFMKNFFGDEIYFSFTRESLLWNRSVEHLHMHFLPGILQGKFLRKMLELQWYPIQENLHIN